MAWIYIHCRLSNNLEVRGVVMATRAMGNACVECDDIITNPICPHCLVREMVVMVGEQDRILAKKIKAFNVPGETRCIHCSTLMGICAYCCTKDVYEYLLEKKPILAREFLNKFDFELRKEVCGM